MRSEAVRGAFLYLYSHIVRCMNVYSFLLYRKNGLFSEYGEQSVLLSKIIPQS